LSKHRAWFGLVATGALVASTWAIAAVPAGAVVEVTSVTICHRTNSNSNPYVQITPAVSGVLNGHDGHDGPVWDPTLKAQHIKWGDIIPPFSYSGGSFAGQNWTEEGQAIWENGCDTDLPPEQEFGSLSVEKDVMGLPLAEGTPVGGTIPDNFTAHVSCDDGTEQDVTFPITGGPGTPATIDNIEAGSNCTVVEQGVLGFPTGTEVSYDPMDVESAGTIVDADEEVLVLITNDFEGVTVDPGTVVNPPADPGTPPQTPLAPAAAPVAAPAAIVAAPGFTG
jgi:hypothetical protein